MYFEYAVEGFPCAEYFQNLGLAYYGQKSYELAMEIFAKAMDKKLAEYEEILTGYATTHDFDDMVSWLLPFYAHPAEFDWDFDRMTEFVCNLLTHPKLPTDCLRYISSMLTDVAGEVDLIRNHPNCDKRTIEHLIHLALDNEETQMAIELLPSASNSAIKSWVTHSNKEFADKAYAVLLREVNLLPMVNDVRNRAERYSQLICEVDSELSVMFAWLCEELDGIDFRKFSETDSIECARIINRFIVDRKKLVDAIADAEPDAEFYDESAKVISRKEALQMADAADWENAWERKLF
jgi:tetratricopeptide (TPR) repeat protein